MSRAHRMDHLVRRVRSGDHFVIVTEPVAAHARRLREDTGGATWRRLDAVGRDGLSLSQQLRDQHAVKSAGHRRRLLAPLLGSASNAFSSAPHAFGCNRTHMQRRRYWLACVVSSTPMRLAPPRAQIFGGLEGPLNHLQIG